MLNNPEPGWDGGKILIFAALAFLGGSLGHIMRTLDANERVIWWRTLLEGISAVFFAFITGLICMENNVSFGWSSAIIGATSWMGSRATFLVIRSITLRKLGVEKKGESND